MCVKFFWRPMAQENHIDFVFKHTDYAYRHTFPLKEGT